MPSQNTPSPSSTLFGGSPSTTSIPSQGSITLYKGASCNIPLSENPTPLLVGSCFNVPIANSINSVSINTLPSCPDYGTPLLVVSNVKDCKNSTAGTGADGGALDVYQGLSSSVENNQVASMEFVCYGRGVSSAKGGAAQTSTLYSAATSSPSYTAQEPGRGRGIM
ncbi:uncharacterized protein PAC_10648 [Phialocephala subalpina]|uniref:Uncharacterized protein n=1 Tax=Phialocephala subalpina TaxID=576137 RepID=A0A1L7X6X3_9HELO|nr:uncharacterized protein PAC_10648 [Phialocephala subalpina]